jgi:hypothetical protein
MEQVSPATWTSALVNCADAVKKKDRTRDADNAADLNNFMIQDIKRDAN